MIPFKVLHGYKPRKPIDLIPMTQHSRLFESTFAFALHIHESHKKSVRKFRKVMRSINPLLICTIDILNLMRVIM